MLLKRCSHRDKCKVSERIYLYGEVSVKAKSKVSKTNKAKGSDASMSPINKFAYNFFLSKCDGIKVRVYRELFLATTAIKMH